MVGLASILMWAWTATWHVLICIASTIIVFGVGGLICAAYCRIVRLAEIVLYLVRQPLAFRVMQAERDQARGAFEAAIRISELRAEAARKMADLKGEQR